MTDVTPHDIPPRSQPDCTSAPCFSRRFTSQNKLFLCFRYFLGIRCYLHIIQMVLIVRKARCGAATCLPKVSGYLSFHSPRRNDTFILSTNYKRVTHWLNCTPLTPWFFVTVYFLCGAHHKLQICLFALLKYKSTLRVVILISFLNQYHLRA